MEHAWDQLLGLIYQGTSIIKNKNSFLQIKQHASVGL